MLAGAATSAFAQTAPTPQAPAGAIVQLTIEQKIDSASSKRGDRFPIRLASPVTVGETVILPAGLVGEGEVVHAQKSGMAGKPGELTLAARFLVKGDDRIALKAMKLGGVGSNNTNTALALALTMAPLAFVVKGGEVVVPAGAQASAKLAAPYPAPVPAAPVTEPEKASSQ